MEMAIGLLLARLLLGVALTAHGSQKLFGWFGGHGPSGTGKFFDGLGWRPGVVFAVAAGLGEVGGGVLTALGLLNPIGPALIVMVMLVAGIAVHAPNGFWAANGGWELTAMNSAAAIALAFAGPGALSLDAALGIHALDGAQNVWIALGCALVLALGNVAIRRPPAPSSAPG
jgi:putative oxidoreductase